MKLNRKNKILIAGLVLSLYICYAFAFSNTISYYSTYTSQKEIVENSIVSPGQLQKLVVREKMLTESLSQYTGVTGASFQNTLLKELSTYSQQHGLKIIDFKEPHRFTEKDLVTTSYTFSLEGSFNGILLLVSQVENNPALGFVRSLTFIKKRNYKTGSDYLTAEVILQRNESAVSPNNNAKT